MDNQTKVALISAELQRRTDAVVAKEKLLHSKEHELKEWEKRLKYRETNVAKRERIILGYINE